jgi:lipoprotein-anchoring transpeptidase ErfK/SrfK
MPFMQRLTWSGIALHAGALPGYPASHGCIRMPSAFAEQLFDLSKIGMRVVVVREDIKPVEITHSRLFQPGPIVSEEPFAAAGHGVPPGQERVGHTWRSIAAAKAKSAAIASATAKAAALAASKARTEAAPFMRKMRIAQGAKLRAEALLRQAESALEAAGTPEAKEAAETLKAQALEHLATAQEDLETLTTEGQAKIDAAAAARDEVKSAEVARVKAYDDVRAAEAKLTPVSVFVSRSTQRLYVRQGFQPIFESPVTISHPEEPIGTIIFAAVGSMHDGSALRWTALSMYAAVATDNLQSSRRPTHRNFGPANTDIGTVKQALERIDIPSETIDRIREIVSPRSSLIISDEPVSRETSKGTDFIILMSGEPQGGIKMRPRDPFAAYRSYRYPRPRPYSESYSPFWR